MVLTYSLEVDAAEPRDMTTDPTFRSGGGACGELIRTLDWQSMPLGPPHTWPESLRTAASICVNSRFPTAIYWGPQFVMLYNDALLPMVGANKHPASFARPAFEGLPEIRELIEPLLVRVRAGNDAVLAEDMMLPLLRHERPEESYFTFTYSAIRDESGDIGGVYCAMVETTEKVIEGRRLRLLNALADAPPSETPESTCVRAAKTLATDPADVPFALLYLVDASSSTATLAGTAGLEPGTPLSPLSVTLGDSSPWPFSPAEERHEPRLLLLEPSTAFGARGAVVIPIARAGGGAPLGFMVLGLSDLLRRTPSYDLFHRLVATSVSQSVGSALAFEMQRRATRETEIALEHAERSEARLRSFLMQAPVPMCILEGPDHRYTLVNPLFTKLVGRSDLVGGSVVDAFPELVEQGFIAMLDQVYASGRAAHGVEVPVRFERRTPGQLEDGFVTFTYEPFRDLDGEIHGILVVALDVSEVVGARRALEREHEIERRARGRAELGAEIGRAFVGTVPLADQLRRCCEALVQVGAAFARIWTYDTNHEVLELQASAGLHTHIDGAHARVPLGAFKIGRIAARRSPHLTNAVVGDPQVPEQAWAKREGLTAFAGYPLVVGDRLMGVVALFSKEALSGETLLALSAIADQIALGIERDAGERFRDLFIGMLGHDLRNPLNAITMGSHLLAPKVAPAQQRTVSRIQSSALRMERMIGQILDFTRARSGGGIPLVRGPADLVAVTAQVVDELAIVYPGRAIETTVEGDGQGLWDVDRLAQVFSNLIANALTYGRKDRPVAVSVTADADSVRWAVRNEGEPIPADLLPTLFDPFRRARHAKQAGTQGLGLGLFITREIIREHKGAILAESDDRGTVLALTLPRSSA